MKSKAIKKFIFFNICLFTCMFFLVGCQNENKKIMVQDENSTEIIVSAAASLSESYTEIAKKIKEEKNIEVVLNFGGSQSLAAAMEEGAGADIFASANTKYMDKLKEKGLISEERIFAKNGLVLCKNNKAKVSVAALSDLSNSEVKLIVGDKVVPIGSYFYDSLDKAIKENKISVEEKDAIIKNIKSSEMNVKDVVSKVLLGVGNIGVVYKTDINDSVRKELDIIELEELSDIYVEYPIGIINSSNKKEVAKEFIDYITNGNGKEILKKHGFTVE